MKPSSQAARRARRSGALGIVLPALLSACASTGAEPRRSAEMPDGRAAVESLADALVRAAERRVDTNAMRVFVDELREARDVRVGAVRIRTGRDELVTVGRELQRELIVALTSRLNLIDVDLARRTAGLAEDAPIEDVARAVGATHALVGTFSPRRDELEVLVRLVDAESLVIVAAVSGVLSVDDLSDLGRLALAPEDPAPIPIVEIPPRPRVALAEPAPVPSTSLSPTPSRGGALSADPQPAVPAADVAPKTSVDVLAGASRDPIEDELERGGDSPLVSPTWPAMTRAVSPPSHTTGSATSAPPALPEVVQLGPAQLRLRALGRSLTDQKNDTETVRPGGR